MPTSEQRPPVAGCSSTSTGSERPDARAAVNETLTSRLIALKRVEAFQAIGEGPNTKLLLHDGRSQLITVLGGTDLR